MATGEAGGLVGDLLQHRDETTRARESRVARMLEAVIDMARVEASVANARRRAGCLPRGQLGAGRDRVAGNSVILQSGKGGSTDRQPASVRSSNARTPSCWVVAT